MFIYEIFHGIALSALIQSEDFKTIFTQYIDFIGGAAFLGTFAMALVIGLIVFVFMSLVYIRIAAKFRKLMKTTRIKNEDSTNENEEGETAEKPEDAMPIAGKTNLLKKKKTGKYNFFCVQLFMSSVTDSEFVKGAQLTCEDSNLDAFVFEELVQERALEDTKKENYQMVFSLLVFLLTRRKMEKMKKVETQPILGLI